MANSILQDTAYDTAIALVGMSGRFPGAQSVEAFWHNLAAGVASIRVFSAEELLAAGIDPALLAQPNYVKAGTVLEGIADFDASFFGYTPREAQVMDPQHRLFLECSWEALERAAYDPRSYAGLIGVFAGSAFNSYLVHHLYPQRELWETVGQLQMDVGNERDSLASTVSYKLNLRGPSLAVQTFCSTSLVAVHLASQSLLNYECDLALAGGVALATQQPRGYLYEAGGILSPDGHCRSFDARAQGSVMGSGVGVVVLKRLREALHDGDNILAVLRGSAINNDGSTRVSYTAPGVEGQASVIAAALSYAGVAPESISYIETHGTATPLGDAVEVAAMKKVFGSASASGPWCTLGSLKPNVGHLDRASGVTGLIKTALALSHEQLPPNLDYEHSSPALALEQSPFHVNTQVQAWPRGAQPRRAGVSSFGLGGTNAHVVLEEAPLREAGSASRPWRLLLLSARSASALETASTNLLRHLQEHPELELADVAYTLQVGRSAFHQRRMLVCQNRDDAIAALSSHDVHRVRSSTLSHRDLPVAFLFSGPGVESLSGLRELYQAEHTFREAVDRCCDILLPLIRQDLRVIIYANTALPVQIDQMQQVHLYSFILEYALAQLYISWGIRPQFLFGVGTGEYVAACLAKVFSLEDALKIISTQAMVAVASRMAATSTNQCHETMANVLGTVTLSAPQIPTISSVTGSWITAEQATDALYWSMLPETPVSTNEGMRNLLAKKGCVLLEIGTEQSLAQTLKQQTASFDQEASLLISIPTEREEMGWHTSLLSCLGQLWLAGVFIDWTNFYTHERRLRVLLPTYPFERKRYWIEDPRVQRYRDEQRANSCSNTGEGNVKKADIAHWFYRPTWKQAPFSAPSVQIATENDAAYVVFCDACGLGVQLAARLKEKGKTVICVQTGSHFTQLNEYTFTLNPGHAADYHALSHALAVSHRIPYTLIHCWTISSSAITSTGREAFASEQDIGLYSLFYLTQAFSSQWSNELVRLLVVSNGLHAITDRDTVQPEKMTVLGACKVIPQEHLNIICRNLDLALPAEGLAASSGSVDAVLQELNVTSGERVVAYRHEQRWVQTYEPVALPQPHVPADTLRQHGVYLIVGGLGCVGVILAEHLAKSVQARLILVGRSALPPCDEWSDWLNSHAENDIIAQKIRRVQYLEALGAQVLVLQADAAEETEMRRVIGQAQEHFGTLHGVIYAAAVSQPEAFTVVQQMSREICGWHFQSKVYGLYTLEHVLQDVSLDFCILFSSISSILGGLGFGGYVAGNLFMDAFVQRHNQQQGNDTRWLSVNWDTWQIRPEGHNGLGGSVAMYAMSKEEGLAVFDRLLARQTLPQLIISTGDLQARIRQWVLLESVQAQVEAAVADRSATVPLGKEYEQLLIAIWQQVLGIEHVGLYDNFFDLGGNSLSAIQVIARMRKVFGTQVPVVALFEAPTISTLVRYLRPEVEKSVSESARLYHELEQRRVQVKQEREPESIAIIGMSGRFPGAATLEQFWQNLSDGVESITFFNDEELLAAGVDENELRDPAYVKARPILTPEQVECFDSAFFGYSPREAELMDPQHRLFLECCWEALEHGGYDPLTYQGLIGVFGGANISSYLHSLLKQPELLASLQEVVNEYQAVIGMDKDSLTTGVSYKLNLKGPSFAVQTFCSTSLVAVHLACQSLRTGECNLALAGGVSIRVPYKTGHLYEPGGMESPDGHCRTFDAQARGSMIGDGVGIVVLKRLAEALQDGDTIHAVIKGSAINNDGSLKVSYTAPSVAGQAEVVKAALANAGVDAESIDYIEAHGTATELGDPIEIASLTKAFRTQTDRQGYCAIGSVKTNIGHLDRAAGVSGLIKTVLALENEELPASLHYIAPNPQIDFAQSPFYVNTQRTLWKRNGKPRRAGVSSLGMGGTNAHVIVEEAPLASVSSPSRPWQLLLLSAKTPTALETATTNLGRYLEQHAYTALADVAYTLQVGRSTFQHRRVVVCNDRLDAAQALKAQETTSLWTAYQKRNDQGVAFLFPDVSAWCASVTQELYDREPTFQAAIDACCSILKQRVGLDLLKALYTEQAERNVEHTNQLATFAIEYALAQLLIEWGIRPQALLGHGVGEYVAACIAGVFSLEDALMLITTAREKRSALALSVRFSAPEIPCIVSGTGTWITPEQATDPNYWSHRVCQSDRLADSIERLLQETDTVLIEIGPGESLCAAVRQHAACTGNRMAQVFATLPMPHEQQPEQYTLLALLGKLWLAGVSIEWTGFHAHERRQRIPLPTYPFERQRYWLGSPLHNQTPANGQPTGKQGNKRPEIPSWFYEPQWQQVALSTGNAMQETSQKPWLVFLDDCGVGQQLTAHLLQHGHTVVCVRSGEQLAQLDATHFMLRPANAADYTALLHMLQASDMLPSRILHCWSISSADDTPSSPVRFAQRQEIGFYSLLYLAKALGQLLYDETVQFFGISSDLHQVTGRERVQAEKAPIVGACKVISQEYSTLSCRCIDIEPQFPLAASAVEALIAECLSPVFEPVVAYREGVRWVQTYQQFQPSTVNQDERQTFRHDGVYLITGGLGHIGLLLASYLGQTYRARLVLTGRTAFPSREQWETWLEQHDNSDPVSQTIRQLRMIEAYGGQVLLIQADVANEGQMRAAIQQTLTTFGTLHGVLHAAGLPSGNTLKPVETISYVDCETQFHAKVYGLFTLEKVLQNVDLDFCLLFSSLSAVLGGLSFVAYAAANLFLDAYVYQHNQRGTATRWLSINWDTWQVKENAHGVLGNTIAAFAMTPHEACAAMEYALKTNATHLVNSTGDLHARLTQWVLLDSLRESFTGEEQTHEGHVQYASIQQGSGDKLEQRVTEVWQQVLGLSQVGREENFFDLGGNSLMGLQLIARLKKTLRISLPIVALFEAPTIALMVHYLQPQAEPIRHTQRDVLAQRRRATRTSTDQHEIAIIGMSGRFPGAATIEQFWQNLSQGRESITFFSDEELLAAGVNPTLLKASNYVKARPVLDQELVEHFDASFFGYSPREAELTDPQHRLFLECSWEALEQAGYAPHDYEGLIGVFGGTNISTYILAQDLNQLAQVNTYQLLAGNDKDSLTSTVSYKLNLHGPSFAVQTFCSTSLVAAHLACQSLRNGECDVALAGGVSIRVPAKGGHLYEDGGMESPDGHCRTFDIRAKGSMFGDGAGVVVLKRLSDALLDGDTIHAVIKGSAVNNDGSLKVSYSAPSVTGQSEVITQALADAGIHAESISYVEAHGTATELGDPIEVAALAKAFRGQTDRQGYCAIGSVKTNVGHLDRAAGISGLIKTVLALKHEALPASLHFEQPNPQIDFVHSPFYVNTQLRPWLRSEHKRIAGVNSLGMGGTNVHMIVEEAPIQVPSGVSRPWQVLLLSARTETALETTRQNISTYLQQQPTASLADVAYTLQVGRKRFEQRCMLVCSNCQEAIDALRTLEPARTYSRFDQHSERSVAFLLPGVGELYEGLAQDLYQQEVVFREAVDRCCDLLKNHLMEDLRVHLFSPITLGAEKNALASLELRALSGHNGTVAGKLTRLNRTDLAQPATFVIEYALAQLLMHWGIRPQAMLGYSLGEYVAACLSGVFSLADALLLVAKRAQWIQALPAGAMLAIALSEQDVQAHLNEQISLAAVNGPTTCTVAGSLAAIARLEAQLLLQGIAYRSIDTTHAFHSAMLHPLKEALTELVGSIQLHAPAIPYLSNVTGTWITAAQATDPAYWAQHMCQTVRFGEGVGHLLQETEHLLLEVGAGQALSSFAKQHPACERERMYMILPTLPSIYEQQPSQAFLLATLGKLWSMGVHVDWTGFYSAEQRRRVALPTYPFERKRYWLEPKKQAFLAQNTSSTTVADELPKIANPDDWFYVPSWKQSLLGENCDLADHLTPLQCWLLFVDAEGIGAQIGDYLRRQDQRVVIVMPGEHFARLSEDTYVVQPDQRADYDALFSDLNSYDFVPQHIVHLWTVSSQTPISNNVNALNIGFYSLLALAQAFGDLGGDSCSISVVSNGVQNVTGNETVDPVKVTILGPCRVMPQEYAALRCRSIDIAYCTGRSWQQDAQIQTLLEEIIADRDEAVVALRGDCRWVPIYEPVQLPGKERAGGRLRNAGVYLITGGLGGIGLALAEHLARTVHAKLALVGRTALPPRSVWPQVLADTEHSTTTGIGRQIRAIQQLEALGADVLVLLADVTDEVQMGVAIQQTLDRFGALHGVLHCAGVPGEGLMQLKTPAMAARVLAPKLAGTLVLEQTLRGLSLDFLVLFSSVTSITGGGPGQVDYCAANAFLDAYARRHAHKHGLTVAIDWGEWQWNAWEAGLAGYGTEAEAFMKENRQRFGISFAEGIEALQRILSSRLAQVVVSTQDFRVIAEQSRSFTAAEVLRRTRALRNSIATHPRPDLASSYSAPHGELEQSIAATWEELLGISAVGIHDNFFELGGNSLIGLDLVARLKKKSRIPSLPAYVLYEAPTVSTLTQYIERMRAGNVEEDEAIVGRHGRGEKRREGFKQRMHEFKRTR